jgi:O-methyltransferase
VTVKGIAKRAILAVADRSRSVRKVARLVAHHTKTELYLRLREQFVTNGHDHPVDEATRTELVTAFERIDKEVRMGSTPTDGLFLAEMLLNTQADGDVVECGCYAGGSSAKLSLVAKLLGRKLYVFDSFEGLPAVDDYYLRDHHCSRSDEWVRDWSAGRYAARLEEVRASIAKYGDVSVCTFVKGWFSETLITGNLPARTAFVFADVDLANSAKDCFTALWPLLPDRGIYATHDAAYIKVLQEFYDPSLWRERFKAVPPILFGAGYGLCADSPHLGYMVKGEGLSPEYLKSLTIEK